MKIITSVKVLALMASMTATTAMAGTVDSLTVLVNGMHCDKCAHKVKTIVKSGPGIEGVRINTERRTVTVAYDASLTCADSIKAHLDATGRYKTSAYSPSDPILRNCSLRIEDMHCQNCFNRISKRLQTVEGIDSLASHLDKHYISVRYDANRTSKGDIRRVLGGLGFTPVNYYDSPKVAFAYYNIPAEAATEETVGEVLALAGVQDANVNARQKSLAVTYMVGETSADALLAAIKAAGIAAVLPPAHECKEGKL